MGGRSARRAARAAQSARCAGTVTSFAAPVWGGGEKSPAPYWGGGRLPNFSEGRHSLGRRVSPATPIRSPHLDGLGPPVREDQCGPASDMTRSRDEGRRRTLMAK